MILSLYSIVCTYRDLRCYCANSSQWFFRPRGLSSQASLRALGALSSNLGLGGPIIQPIGLGALSSISHSRPISTHPIIIQDTWLCRVTGGETRVPSVKKKGFDQYSQRDGMGTLHCKENWIYVYAEKELRGLSPNSYIHVSVSDLYIPRIGPHIWLQQNRQTDPGNNKSVTDIWE